MQKTSAGMAYVFLGVKGPKNTGSYILYLSKCLAVLEPSALADTVDILSINAYKVWVFIHFW